MNAYPMTSTTFIRREIEALEDIGVSIQRYAVRKWAEKLVDPRDIDEARRTQYLLTNNIPKLILALVKEVLFRPMRFSRAVKVWLVLIRNARGGLIKHLAYLVEATYFSQLSRSQRISHVHVHFATNATAVALLSQIMGGPSYSFTVHGPDELVSPANLSIPLKIQYASFVIAISQFCKGRLIEVASGHFAEKIAIGRCGLALEEFESVPPLHSPNQSLVCVGRLCPQKGQILIPPAAARLRGEFPALKIVLVGDGELRGAIESSIKLHKVGDVVTVKGWLANREVLELIKSSRALVLPSYAEGLPVVIMEALALRRPVISTLIAGIPELVDDSCGWLFPPGDEEGFVAVLRKALSVTPIQLEKMGEVGRIRVMKLHNRRELARTLYAAFENQIRGGGGHLER